MMSRSKDIKKMFTFDRLLEGMILSISLFGCAIVAFQTINPDLFFILNTGKHIYEAKRLFPTTLFSSVHDGFATVIQQPLYSLIIYLLFNVLGLMAIPVIGIFSAVLCLILFYVLFKPIRQRTIRIVLSSVLLLLCCFAFTGRPFGITINLLLLTILVLEKVHSGTMVASLLLIPISFLQLVCHAAFYPFVILLSIVYLVSLIRKKVGDDIYLFIFNIGVSVIVSLCTPYGIKLPLYVLFSYKAAAVDVNILELARPSILSVHGIVIAFFLFLLLKTYKNVQPFRTVLLLLGIIFACMHLRNLYLLCVFAVPYLRRAASGYDSDEGEQDNTLVLFIPLITLLLLFGICSVKYADRAITDSTSTPVGGAEYLKDKESLRVFTNFNNGAFMEYCGFNVYIDARPELFTKVMNGQRDVLSEYMELYLGYGFDYESFLKYYDFDYLIVDEESHLNEYLMFSGQKPCYTGNGYLVYKGLK